MMADAHMRTMVREHGMSSKPYTDGRGTQDMQREDCCEHHVSQLPEGRDSGGLLMGCVPSTARQWDHPRPHATQITQLKSCVLQPAKIAGLSRLLRGHRLPLWTQWS